MIGNARPESLENKILQTGVRTAVFNYHHLNGMGLVQRTQNRLLNEFPPIIHRYGYGDVGAGQHHGGMAIFPGFGMKGTRRAIRSQTFAFNHR